MCTALGAGYHAGGEAEAHRKLDHFLAHCLAKYAAQRNDLALVGTR
jgi:deoxyribodipyrimidine photolyase